MDTTQQGMEPLQGKIEEFSIAEGHKHFKEKQQCFMTPTYRYIVVSAKIRVRALVSAKISSGHRPCSKMIDFAILKLKNS